MNDDQHATAAHPVGPMTARRTVLRSAAALGVGGAVAAGVAGCGGDDSSSVAGGEDYEPGSADLKVALGEELDGVLYPEGYEGPRYREPEPFGDGTTEFTVIGRSIPDLDYSTNYYAGLVEEKTGVKIKYLDVPLGDDGQTKVNAMLSSGELPHGLMAGYDLFTVSELAVYGAQGLFVPLDRLIDEYAPHVRDMFDTFPDMRRLYTSPDGVLYTMPSMNDCFHCKSGAVRTWYNSAWMEAVGGDVPSTLDEFDALLDEFADLSSRPSGSVLTTASSTTTMQLFNFFLGAFLEAPEENMVVLDGKVTWNPTRDAYREGFIWLQDQFSKQHFDTGLFSLTDDQLCRLGDNQAGPAFGVVPGNSQGAFSKAADVTDPANVGAIMQPLPPLAGPDGVRTSDWKWYSLGAPGFVVTSSCPDPETLVRWADHQYELSMTISMGRGEQGVDWEFSKKGAQGIDGEQAVYAITSSDDAKSNKIWWEWGPFYKSMGQRHGEEVEKGSSSIEPSLYDAGKAYEPYAMAKELKLPELAFDLDQAAQVGEAQTNLTQFLTQSFADFCTGTTDASKDADWQAYVDKFDDIGLSDYLSVQQSAYDAQS